MIWGECGVVVIVLWGWRLADAASLNMKDSLRHHLSPQVKRIWSTSPRLKRFQLFFGTEVTEKEWSCFSKASRCPFSERTGTLKGERWDLYGSKEVCCHLIDAFTHTSHFWKDFEVEAAMRLLNWTEVKEDLVKVMTDSKEWWPADYGRWLPWVEQCDGFYLLHTTLEWTFLKWLAYSKS